MGRVDGKVAIISGGARGMGAAHARLLAAEGAKVAIGDILDDLGEQLAAEIGDSARYVHLDVTNPDHWVTAVDTATGEFGKLNVLVNNAGIVNGAHLDQLGLTEGVTSISGISAVGAAAMLAEIGDPTRFDSARALVKHAGLCPRENASGTFTGQSRISRRGRPRLRLAAWRAVWGALPHNPVMAARYQHLTTRNTNQLSDGQARAAIAAALLRWIHVITTRRITWAAAAAGAGELLTAA
jgi:NAD(P)-dependent dehydrogenase (short-subunit alcohol dehydrogenase family)